MKLQYIKMILIYYLIYYHYGFSSSDISDTSSKLGDKRFSCSSSRVLSGVSFMISGKSKVSGSRKNK